MDDQNNQTAQAEAAALEAAAKAKAEAEAQAAADAEKAKAEKAPKQRATGTRVRRQAITTVTNPMTAASSVQETIEETDLAEPPASIKLASPYAFYDDDGALHSWAAGQVVSDPGEVATLIERGALIEEE